MKILALADIHAHNYKSHSTILPNGLNSRLVDIGNAVEEAFDIGLSKGCDICVIAGDIFHVRGHIKPQVYNYVFDIVKHMAKSIPVYMVSGNHDMESRLGISALEPFNSIDNCFVIDYKTVSFGGYNISGIPYIKDVQEFQKEFDKVKNSDIILMHQGIDNFRGSTNIPETSITVQYLQERSDAYIVSGHYHNKCCFDKVLSPGCPIQYNFGDEDDKGCWIIDTKNNGIVYYGLSYPRFCTISKDELEQDYTGKIVRIRLSDSDNIGEIKERIGDCIDLQIEVIKEFTSNHEKTVKIGEPYDMLSEYIDCIPVYNNIKDDLMKQFNKICA